jgi:O-antigen/teichoic acid export membrane protein
MKYSLPLMPHALSGWIMTLFDRLLLNGLKDASTVGIYNVGYQFANIVNLLITSFERAYSPWFYSEADTESGRKKVALMAEMGMGAFASIGLAISLFSPEVIHLVVNERFERAWVVIPFLSSAFVVRGAYFFFIGPVFKSSTKSLPLITFSAALGGIGMNLLLIPYLGSVGSAIATMVSNFLSSILAKIVGSRFMVIPFRIKVIYGWWIFGFILSLFPLLELPISLVWAACIKIALLSVFCVFFIKYYAGELRSVVGPYYLRLRKRFRNEDQA